jgi:hypothetical protein
MMILMGLILKIPVLGGAWLIWHAVRQEPDPAQAAEEEGGEDQRRHFRREPNRPRGPRRGPHAPDALPVPCADEERLQVLRRRPAASPLTAAAREREAARERH